jgi:hypothetical protein
MKLICGGAYPDALPGSTDFPDHLPVYCRCQLVNSSLNKPVRSKKLWAVLTVALLSVSAGLWCGCRSANPVAGNPSLAAVEIRGHSSMEVARAVSEVFREAGYVPLPLPANKNMSLVFDKQGGTTDRVVYGNLVGSEVWYRIKINIETIESNTHIVSGDAFRVIDHGDARFEEETKLSALKSSTYQELLDRVKARLNP